MSFDRIFAAAYIDNENTHKVLGVKLVPFCAWHLFLLQVIDSPFLKSGEVVLYDLRRAVGVCRLTYCHSRPKLPWSLLTMTQKRLSKEVEKFMIYITDYLHKPDYSIIPFDEFGRGSVPTRNPAPPPDVIQLVFDAAKGANVPIQDAWNMPIGQTYIAQAMYYKQNGVMVDFMNEDEREFQEKLKEHLRETEHNNGNTTH